MLRYEFARRRVATSPSERDRMATWLWILIIVIVVLLVLGYFGRGRLNR